MSRSNTNYYNICTGSKYWQPVGDDGYCGLHRGRLGRRGGKCIAPGKYRTRRGIVTRKPRFPRHSWKTHSSNPPHDIKRYWRKQIRQSARMEIHHQPEDPILMPEQKWLAGKFQYWS